MEPPDKPTPVREVPRAELMAEQVQALAKLRQVMISVDFNQTSR